jgi:hypothetical protein
MVENCIDLLEADSSNYFTIRINSRAISIYLPNRSVLQVILPFSADLVTEK